MEGNATKPISQSFDCPKPLSLSLYIPATKQERWGWGTGRETTSFASYISCLFFGEGFLLTSGAIVCCLLSFILFFVVFFFLLAFSALSLLCAIIKWFCGLLLTNLLDFHLHRVAEWPPIWPLNCLSNSAKFSAVDWREISQQFHAFPQLSIKSITSLRGGGEGKPAGRRSATMRHVKSISNGRGQRRRRRHRPH